MVLTRSQATKADQRELESMVYPSDNESECSVPEVLSRDQIDELDGGNLIRTDYNSEHRSTDQRFSDMNKQISDLTGLVLALTEKLSSNVGEGNNQSTASDKTCARSDMVTGVSPTNYLMNPHPTHQSTSRYPQPPAHQFNDIVTEIHHLRDTMMDTVQHPKILQTQVPLFRGNREKYNEFEHLLLNHLRPHQHKLSEEQKLTYFQSLLRDDAIEFWQSLKMTNQTTLAQVLRYFKKEYAKKDLKEVAKYKFDQMRYDTSAETFNDFLNKFKKVAKQAFGDKSSDITETFLFAKLPVQMQNELAMAGKHDASMEEIRTFVQRRCQYAQLIPNTTSAQPFNQISAPQPNAATPPTSTAQPQQTRETKRKFDVQCRHCGIHGHKWAECRKRLREEAQAKTANQNPSNQIQLPRTQTIDPSSTQNLCAKSAERWDTLPETVTTGTGPPQQTEVFRTPNNPQKKTNISKGTLDKTTTEYAPPMSCPTLARK